MKPKKATENQIKHNDQNIPKEKYYVEQIPRKNPHAVMFLLFPLMYSSSVDYFNKYK